MFINEKQLVDKLVYDLEERYNTRYIVRELRGGYNIADVVCASDINRNSVIFNEYYNAYYYYNNIYNKKKICLDETDIIDTRESRTIHRFLRDLEEKGYVRIDGDYVTSIKKVDAVTKNFIAVEAKLYDWKSGLEQALRYKQYANEVYVAISSEYLDKVKGEFFKELNIGLMSVSDGKLKVPIRAKKEKVKKLDVQYFIGDRFLKQLKKANICV